MDGLTAGWVQREGRSVLHGRAQHSTGQGRKRWVDVDLGPKAILGSGGSERMWLAEVQGGIGVEGCDWTLKAMAHCLGGASSCLFLLGSTAG